MKKLLPILLVTLVACSKGDLYEPEQKYSRVKIEDLYLNQYPFVGQDYEWDEPGWFGSSAPDVYVVVKNQDGAIFYVTDTYTDTELYDMPVQWYWWFMDQFPGYRDQIIFEVYDEDEGEDEFMGRVSMFPFKLDAHDAYAQFDVTEGQISISGSLIFME